jgi:hypothetical protein
VVVGPDPKVARRNARIALDRRCLGHDEAEATQRKLAQVHQQIIVGESLVGRVLVHGCQHDSVGDRHATDMQRREQHRPGHQPSPCVIDLKRPFSRARRAAT